MNNLSFIATCAALLTALATMTAGAEETARDIAVKFEAEKAAALESYLAENPEAGDKDEAVSLLVNALLITENSDKLIPLLTERYASIDKGPNADLAVLSGIGRPLVAAYQMAEDNAGAIAFIDQVKKDFEEHPAVYSIHQFFDDLAKSLKLPGIGDTMVVAFTDLNGEEVDTSKLKGKVVLVDFWATWCTPCIVELPNLIAAYEEYKDKGFAMVGISLDEKRDELEGFLNHPQWKAMDWPQHFDGKGADNEIAVQFGVGRLPSTFLLDQEGKVVATDLHGTQLKEKLAELLD